MEPKHYLNSANLLTTEPLKTNPREILIKPYTLIWENTFETVDKTLSYLFYSPIGLKNYVSSFTQKFILFSINCVLLVGDLGTS